MKSSNSAPPSQPKADRLPRSERNRRARAAQAWQHALDRLRERHDASAELIDVVALGARAGSIYQSWVNKCRTSEGAVVRYEGVDSVIVRLQYGEKWICVVLNPLTAKLRTVLP